MGKSVCTTLLCQGFSYPIINYLYEIARIPGVSKVFVILWDTAILAEPGFKDSLRANQTPRDKVAEISEHTRKFFRYFGIDCEVVMYSDARERLFRSEAIGELFYSVLSHISMDDIFDYYNQTPFLGSRRGSMSRLVYRTVDFLTCLHFDTIYPEFGSHTIDFYFASSRFEPVLSATRLALRDHPETLLPRIQFASPVFVLNHGEGRWVTWDFSKSEIHSEVERHAATYGLSGGDVRGLRAVFEPFLEGYLYNPKTKRFDPAGKMDAFFKRATREELVDFVTENMFAYLQRVQAAIESTEIGEVKRTIVVREGSEFRAMSSLLNPSKIRLINLCDGTLSVKEIVRKSHMSPNSVQSYLSQLRKQGVISRDKKPMRKINEIRFLFG